MIQYLKQNKLLLFFTIIFNAISSLGFVLIAIVLQEILDTVIANDMQMFKRITVITVTYLVLLGLFLYLQSMFTKKMNCRIMYSIRSKMFNGIINQTIEDYNKKNTADYMSALNNDVKLIEDNYLLPLLEIIQYGIVFIASLGVMIYFDIIMTICVVVAILFMLIIPNIFGGILEKRQNNFSTHLSSFTNNIKDLLSGFEIIKSYSMKSYVKTRFDKSNESTINAKYDVDKIIAANEGLSTTLSLFVQIFVVLLSAYFILTGRTTMGTLIGMVQTSSNLANPILMIFNNIPKLKSVKPIIEKIDDYVTYEHKDFLGTKTPTFKSAITTKNLSFSYNPDNEVLKDISLSIDYGRKYVLVGKSGCGKTSLIKLLTGYYSDYKGSIHYDSEELSQLNIENVSEMSSIIHQNIYMFDETIYDNICLHERYSESELKDSLEKSGLQDFISQIDDGVSYKVGENGSNLSGGQRQRIAVARALIRNKPLLILDEGTSAIDMQTAYDIEDKLLQIKNLTLLTITHNMKKELLELYDNIIYMEAGRIVEIGSFHELIQKESAFYDYFNLKISKR